MPCPPEKLDRRQRSHSRRPADLWLFRSTMDPLIFAAQRSHAAPYTQAIGRPRTQTSGTNAPSSQQILTPRPKAAKRTERPSRPFLKNRDSHGDTKHGEKLSTGTPTFPSASASQAITLPQPPPPQSQHPSACKTEKRRGFGIFKTFNPRCPESATLRSSFVDSQFLHPKRSFPSTSRSAWHLP